MSESRNLVSQLRHLENLGEATRIELMWQEWAEDALNLLASVGSIAQEGLEDTGFNDAEGTLYRILDLLQKEGIKDFYQPLEEDD